MRVLARVRRRAVRVGIWVVDSKLDCEWFPMFFLSFLVLSGCADRDSFSSHFFYTLIVGRCKTSRESTSTSISKKSRTNALYLYTSNPIQTKMNITHGNGNGNGCKSFNTLTHGRLSSFPPHPSIKYFLRRRILFPSVHTTIRPVRRHGRRLGSSYSPLG